jgi:hypothetical protein
MLLFLDYYHPYAGLCNQLYLITNHIHAAFLNGDQIYINKFNIDIFKKTRIPISGVLDLTKTHQNLLKLGIDVLTFKKPKIIEKIPQLCIYPVSSIEILNSLEFNNLFVDIASKIQKQIGNYNGIHFRLDIDAVLHYTFGDPVYNKFMDLANESISAAGEYLQTLDIQRIEHFCNNLLQQYLGHIEQIGFENTWYICTTIAKDPLNCFTKAYRDYLLKFINEKGGKWYIHPKEFKERELNALVDLLVLRDSENLIGFEGSSFSEGYCLKVNTFRKNIKKSLCVNVNYEV